MIKSCAVCETKFEKVRPMQKVCSPLCAIKYPQVLAEKIQRQQWKREKADFRLGDKRDQLKKAQANFNKFIRLRDEGLPCISCQRVHKGQMHAGHYRSVGGNPELRFNEDNCFAQCAACNNHLSGNIANYRINLVKRVGDKKVEWLEGPHEPKHYSIEEVIEIKKRYAALCREMSK